MARTHSLTMTTVVMICLVSTQWNGTLFASGDEASSREAASSQPQVGGTSETPVSTLEGPAPVDSIGQQPAETTASAAPLPQTERSRFTFNDVDLTANSPLGFSLQRSRRAFNVGPAQSSAFAGQVYQGRPIRSARDGSMAAMMIGAVASITGAAILIYANRPECSMSQFGSGCGYGTKVVGGAVLSGGIVSLLVGAWTWR
jgi:hypothetical protein